MINDKKESRAPNREQVRVLTVEDDEDDVVTIRDLLQNASLIETSTDNAGTLAQALTALEESFDVILLDLSLPDSQGLETFSAVFARAPHIPIIILSGLDDETFAVRAVQEGAQDYLVKGRIDGHHLARDMRYAIERKRLETALRAAHDGLEMRVSERTADLAGANAELRKAITKLRKHDEAQSRFVSNVSHELRTPLSSMTYAIENMLRGVMGPISEGIRGYLHMLREDAMRLRNTVHDILDLSRLESNTLPIRRVPLPFPRVVTQATESLRGNAAVKKQTLLVSADCVPCFVSGDHGRIERVILNIVSNALKYTPDGGRIEVHVLRPNDRPECIEVRVTDDGIGIAPQHLPRVAEQYYRVGEHIDGTGLGLYISREILKRHGAELDISSPPPGRECGTRATMVFPLSAPPRILVVDDTPQVRQMLQDELNTQGYGVQVAPSGMNALQAMRDHPPDVVLLDLFLHDMDGTELLFRMRADHALREIPVAALLDGPLDDATHCILKGFGVPVLYQPWTTEDLQTAIETTMVRVTDDSRHQPPQATAEPHPPGCVNGEPSETDVVATGPREVQRE